MPPSYATRLRTIHTIATEHVYGAEAIVTTPETPQGGFETYITIGDYIHKYREIPMKTASTIETIAIYHSLRYITNVLGYHRSQLPNFSNADVCNTQSQLRYHFTTILRQCYHHSQSKYI